MTGANHGRMISTMRLPATLAWLVDAASAMPTADSFLAGLAERLMADGVPLSGGALTLTTPHPIIARRAWLWQAETGAVIEALDFGSMAPIGPERGKVGRDWLLELCAAAAQGFVVASAPDDQAPIGPASDRPLLDWAVSRPLADAELVLLHQVGRFSAGPLTAIGTRTTLRRCSKPISADAVRPRSWPDDCAGSPERPFARSCFTATCAALRRCRRQCLRRRWSLRSTLGSIASRAPFTPLAAKCSSSLATACGDFSDRANNHPLHPAMPLCARSAAARAGMAHLDQARGSRGLPLLPFGIALHLGEMLWGNIGTADRLDFTAIGPAVNLVNRLEGLCKPLGRNVLVSGAVAAETRAALIPLGEHRLRGIAEPCAVFSLPDD